MMMMMMIRYFLRASYALLHLYLHLPLIYEYHNDGHLHEKLPLMDIHSHLLYNVSVYKDDNYILCIITNIRSVVSVSHLYISSIHYRYI